MNKKIIRSVCSVCAAAGFLSSLFAPCHSSEGRVFSAPELVQNAEPVQEVISAEKFEDIDTRAWYFPYVDMLVKNGIINGISETEYSPQGSFNAAECAAVITRYLGLEEYAAQRQEYLVSIGSVGCEKWYSGYLQTLFDIGVVTDGEYGITSEEGIVAINSAEEFARPLKRYEFAVMITRSFDTKTDTVFAKSFYPEINDNGNHFIIGGKYDGTVEKYAAEIADYWYIPEEARWDVLKAYYNGIFNGDEMGNFNPGSALTRAEMSKVVAVISDPSMRKRNEYRTLADGFVFDDESFVTDGFGEKVLDREIAKGVLETVAQGISAKESDQGVCVSFLPCAYPEGYFAELRFYEKDGEKYVEIEKTELSDAEPLEIVADEVRVLLVLRNLRDAKVEGALRVDIASDASFASDDLFKPVV
ncbi:MAG: S-layer homology domain-containing protein [Ruminococcaceae bacterium]|nr:S-layer homology domain-containing protein [Oscillospiraceae bacterium]